MNQAFELPHALEILQSAPLGVLVMDDKQRVVWLNHAMENHLGMSLDDFKDRSIDELLNTSLKSLLSADATFTMPANSSQGSRQIKSWHHSFEDASGMVCYFVDVTEQNNLQAENERLKQEIEAKSTRDPLTGLLNQRGLMQALESQVTRSRRYNNPLSLIRMAIVDDGAEGNEERGQQVLTAISYLLNDQLRWADVAGRSDDGHFLLILPETLKDATDRLVEKVTAQLSNLRINEGADTVAVKACFGITSYGKGDDISKLLGRSGALLANALQENVLAVSD
jgi:diguanylate cyclase (GGDEF)-like protein